MDYDKDAPATKAFFAKVQNELHYAIHGQTATELIRKRADSSKPHIGLISRANAPEGKILKTGVAVAKNYLAKDGLDSLVSFARNAGLFLELSLQITEITIGGKPASVISAGRTIQRNGGAMGNRFLQKLKEANRFRKRWWRDRQAWLMRAMHRPGQPLIPGSCRHVAILLLDHGIGDAIVLSGLIYALRQSGRSVTIITASRLAHVFRTIVPVDAVVCVDERTGRLLYGVLRRAAIDLLIDFQFYAGLKRLERIRIIRAARPVHAVGFNDDGNLFDTVLYTRRTEHITDRIMPLLQMLGVGAPNGYRYRVTFGQGSTVASSRLVAAIRAHYRCVVVFNPLGGDERRSLSQAQVRQFIVHCARIDWACVVLLNMQVAPQPLPDNIRICPFQDIENAFNLVRLADLVVSVDTSIVHLACAFDKPLISIYNNKVTEINDANTVWRPIGSSTAQLCTADREGRPDGDDVKKFDLARLFAVMDSFLGARKFPDAPV